MFRGADISQKTTIQGSNAARETRNSRMAQIIMSPYLSLFVIIMLLSVGGIASGELLSGRYGNLGSYAIAAMVGLVALAITLILRQDGVALVMVLATRVYVDWYLGLGLVAQPMAIILLTVLYLTRSAQRPWRQPQVLWLWLLMLIIALYPASHGLGFPDEVYYYSNVFLSAFLMFWLGQVMARDASSIKRLLNFVALFAALIALHSIIEYTTGKMLFSTSSYDSYECFSYWLVFCQSRLGRRFFLYDVADSTGTLCE